MPTRLPIIVNKAVALINLGCDEEAEKTAHMALKIDPLYEETYSALGEIFQNIIKP